MSWKYYKNGKLQVECDDVPEDIAFNDIPETMEDAVIELQANGHDGSNCVVEPESNKDDTLPPICDDFWSEDYPPEEDEYQDTMTFVPLTDAEVIELEKAIQILKEDMPKASNDFMDKLYKRIKQETGVNMKPTRLDSIKSWWINVTTGSKVYLAFWIIFTYILLGMIIQDRQILHSFLEIVLWPLFL